MASATLEEEQVEQQAPQPEPRSISLDDLRVSMGASGPESGAGDAGATGTPGDLGFSFSEGKAVNELFIECIAGLTMPFETAGDGIVMKPRSRAEYVQAMKNSLVPIATMLRFHEIFIYGAGLSLPIRAGVFIGIMGLFILMYHPGIKWKKDEKPKNVPKEKTGEQVAQEAEALRKAEEVK